MMTDGAEQPQDPEEIIERYFEEIADRYQIVEAEAKAKPQSDAFRKCCQDAHGIHSRNSGFRRARPGIGG